MAVVIDVASPPVTATLVETANLLVRGDCLVTRRVVQDNRHAVGVVTVEGQVDGVSVAGCQWPKR